MFATVQLKPGATLSNPDLALLAFSATSIFNAMLLQQANIPANTAFAAALTDYFQDATFQPALAALAPAVNLAVDQGQPVIGLGRNDIGQTASTGTLRGTVVDPDGVPLAGVLVVATQQGTTVRTATTDTRGAFTLADLPSGSTTVTATRGSLQTSRTLPVISVPTFSLTLSLGVTDAPPTLSALTPASGPAAGGIILTLTGTHFQPGATVTIGGTAATAVTVTSATQLTATTPASPAGSAAAVVAVVVTNPDGQRTALAGAFTYLAPPRH
jgi:hypothetical protein